jgi:hypothetical protein
MEWMAPAKRQIQSLGEYGAIPDAVAKLARGLADRYEALHFFCCKASQGVWTVSTAPGAGTELQRPR